MTPPSRSSGHALLVTLCLAAASLGAGGCSFIFVDGPPTQHKKMPYFDCTSSNALPVVDVVIAAAEGLAAASDLASRDQYDSSSATTMAATQLGVAALFAASGISGFSKTGACREAKDELTARAQRQQGYGAVGFAPASPPPGYGAPPVPYDPWTAAPPPGAAARFAPPPDVSPPGAPAAPPGAAPAAPPAAPAPPAAEQEAPPHP
jgi:hypothetical protein